MSSQILSHILSGPFFGDLTPSDSSPDQPVGAEVPTPSSLTLNRFNYVVEKSTTGSDPNYGLNKIEGCEPDASQGQLGSCKRLYRSKYMLKCNSSLSDHVHSKDVLDVRLDALPSISAEGSFCLEQQNLVDSEQKILLGLSHLPHGETQADYRSSRIEPPMLAAVKECSANPVDCEHLTKPTSPLDPDLSQTPSPEVAQSGFSHRIDFESCEGLPSLLPESFKSTGGQSDDILPRPIFNVEKENQETDMKANFSINPENLPDPVFPPVIHCLEIADPDSTTTRIPLAQKATSHENATTRRLSHHSDVPSSSPIVRTEYSQSDPYFTPATIFRAHSPDIRKNVVGTPELNSSSPPSSPSMSSNYLPTSSPVPSSSPMDRTVHTPPVPSPTVPAEYGHSLPQGFQEEYYPQDPYASFQHYPMDQRPYHTLHQQESNDFFGPDPQQHSATTMSQPIIPTSFIQNYFEGVRELPKNVEPYPPPELNLAAAEPLSSTHDPSSQKVEPPAPKIDSNPQSKQEQKPSLKNVVPNPKRPTLAGVRQQQKKLAKPFRSPVIHPPVRLAPKPPTQSSEPLVSSANSAYLKEAGEGSKNPNVSSSSSSTGLAEGKMKHRTAKAAAPFKSPLSSSSISSDEAALVRLTPTIQSLERKLQLLRRALKVREEVQEEVLEGLVNKWSEAGKEVAWEMWDAVKDNANTAEGSEWKDKKGKKRAVEENWGWDERPERKKAKKDEEGERNWGWDVVPVGEGASEDSHGEVEGSSQQEEERTEETVQPSLGTMLLQLGIAPETFGWSEEEGDFVDRPE